MSPHSSSEPLKAFIQHLEDTAFFLELQAANPFRIRALKNAQESLSSLKEAEFLEKQASGSLTEIKGIGKGIAAMAAQFVDKSGTQEFEEAKAELPASLLELKQVRGLGPKKVLQLYEGLGVASLGELEYACNENRLIELKGFGPKTQAKLVDEIQQLKIRASQLLLPDALEAAQKLEKKFKPAANFVRVGQLSRLQESMESLDFLFLEDKNSRQKEDAFIEKLREERLKKSKTGSFRLAETRSSSGPLLRFYFCSEFHTFIIGQIFLSSSEEHWTSLQRKAASKKLKLTETALLKGEQKLDLESVEDLYEQLGCDFHPPESREFSVETSKKLLVVNRSELTGVFHAHSTYSDGKNSLEEMARAAEKQSWSYLGISEHSQTAVYASGLREDSLKKQWAEIDQLNRKLKHLKILKGIESDILKNGSLDYPSTTLKKFDFVIASIHQRYGLSDMTDRLIKAIEQPTTSMLGHWSGRLVLSRPAYQMNKTKVIQAAIENSVIIELNSHPQRLDMDWRDLFEAARQGLLISINPDAHSVEAFDDVQYGVWMARKALVPPKQIVNTWPLEDLEKFLCRKKSA